MLALIRKDVKCAHSPPFECVLISGPGPVQRSGPLGFHLLRRLNEAPFQAGLGTVNRNSLPRPNSLSASIRPPWACTMPWVMYSPRPLPVGLFSV